jgi:hypothetical protein
MGAGIHDINKHSSKLGIKEIPLAAIAANVSP